MKNEYTVIYHQVHYIQIKRKINTLTPKVDKCSNYDEIRYYDNDTQDENQRSLSQCLYIFIK